MDIEGFKKLVKKYEPLHAAFVNDAMTGERYYKNGSDILFGRKKEDGEGNALRNADNRIPRNFHGLLVNQKASYAFTVPPLIDVGDAGADRCIMEALGDMYTKNCMELCINAANASVAWVHYWTDGENGFRWAVVGSQQVIPVWDRSLERKLLGVMRVYGETDEETGEDYTIYEYWTDTCCQAYRRRTADTVDRGMQYYGMFTGPSESEKSAEYQHGMGEVPFIPFFNNNIHTSDLKNIKKLVDVYDKVYSGFINDLDDVQEIILVLSGYGGTELEGFLQELKKYKVISLDGDKDENAGVSTLNIEIPVEARNTVLEMTRKAIFEQGQGFDPQPEKFGNQSGEALKFMYSLLEMKTGLTETEFRPGFSKLVRAICRHKGIKCSTVNQTWTRTRIRNDAELVQMCRDSEGIISQRTILKNHPFVTDVEEELKQMEKERQAAEEKEDAYQDAFTGGTDGSSKTAEEKGRDGKIQNN